MLVENCAAGDEGRTREVIEREAHNGLIEVDSARPAAEPAGEPALEWLRYAGGEHSRGLRTENGEQRLLLQKLTKATKVVGRNATRIPQVLNPSCLLR